MHGRTARLVSQTPGWAGLLGTYGDQGFVELTGTRSAWEGPGNEVGFYPYRLDDGWCAFFGGNTVPAEVGTNQWFFGVGLVRATTIGAPVAAPRGTQPSPDGSYFRREPSRRPPGA